MIHQSDRSSAAQPSAWCSQPHIETGISHVFQHPSHGQGAGQEAQRGGAARGAKRKAAGALHTAAATRPAAPPPPPPPAQEDTPTDAHAAAAALYPSMRPDYDPEARAADEAPRKRTVVVEDAARPTSVFLSGLPLTVKDSELQTFLRGCGVLHSIKKVRDRGVFNGCAIVTFGGCGPCGNQPGSYVASMAWGA